MSIEKKARARTRMEDDPNFHRLEKISPVEFYVTTGPGELEGKYYAVVMAPNEDWCPEIDEFVEKDIPVAKCRYGFDDPKTALLDCARQFPSLPILLGPDEFSYPFYDVRKMRILVEADQRRKAKAVKAQRNYNKSKEQQELLKTVPIDSLDDRERKTEVRVKKTSKD